MDGGVHSCGSATPVTSVLLLYDSRGGLTEQLAEAVEEGIVQAGAQCVRRRIDDAMPADLLSADGFVIGSPNWSGMTGKLKDWFDYSGDLWESGELAGKPGGALHSRLFAVGWDRSDAVAAASPAALSRDRVCRIAVE